ncbi:pRiA4b ORF-3-like protein [Pseudogracilibacillus auburnensis]|uniref:PRiA4b ORF-3-like protein n=2 Tax=Pseudogracilibacillus auburnensis TaxID=1494959 RepID=A0A2V3VNV6_9BACI|nr:pRiA4b ORF-3-like protein [Pseudogracilibacillus auburnensis]
MLINRINKWGDKMILELNVTLQHVGVLVTRTVEIDAQHTFYDLHLLLQETFNWTDSHLHEFTVKRTDGKDMNGVEISPEEYDQFEHSPLNTEKRLIEKEEMLRDWFVQENDKIMYLYDYGDNWEHEILLESIKTKETDVPYPRCSKAINLAPPENSRGELLMGNIDLEYNNSKKLVDEINQRLTKWTDHMHPDFFQEEVIDYWPETLLMAKQFQQIKPWEEMSDELIFAILDPVSEQYMFCSVIGNAEEMYGLTVYIGMDGFFALLDTLTSDRNEFEILQRQHSLLVSFENRTDLDRSEYNLIKMYDIPFRGKKAWPSFVSFKPGLYPWLMENDEARMVLLAMEETLLLHKEIQTGLQLPDLLKDEKIFVKAKPDKTDTFNNFVLDLNAFLAANPEVELTISELCLKRVKKMRRTLPMTIEFTLTYVNMPIKVEQKERPIFPVAVMVADHDKEIIIHHEMYEQRIDPFIAQKELIHVFHQVEGVPQTILTDDRTYYYISPLLGDLNINIQIVNSLPVIDALLAGLHGYLSSEE